MTEVIKTLPPLPAGWPEALPIGISDGLGGAASFRQAAPVAIRYQYLAGGVNTGHGWRTWSPNDSFVGRYLAESRQQGAIPVLSYYMMSQSAPGGGSSEQDALFANMQNSATMRAYFEDLERLFRGAGADGELVVLHVEPDLWGFLQQRALSGDASSVPVKVGSAGVTALADLPDSLTGFTRAIVRLRDVNAPNVLLAYHLSGWGTGTDILRAKPSDATVDQLAHSAAEFYSSLGADFDLLFSEFNDRDAGFKEHVYGDRGASWWGNGDHRRFARFLAGVAQVTQRRVILWQIPIGNTRMRAANNTWGHYQDSLVEWLLDDPHRDHISQYLDVGVIGFLFGPGAAGATCYCDAANDGLTNPAPINGNVGASLSSDDDGGYFRQRLAAYYAEGPLPQRRQ